MPIITSTDITASREIASVDVSASNAVTIGTEVLGSSFSSSIASRVAAAGGSSFTSAGISGSFNEGFEFDGNISGSATSTGSFGKLLATAPANHPIVRLSRHGNDQALQITMDSSNDLSAFRFDYIDGSTAYTSFYSTLNGIHIGADFDGNDLGNNALDLGKGESATIGFADDVTLQNSSLAVSASIGIGTTSVPASGLYVAVGNISGSSTSTGSFGKIVGTLLTAAQPNITSVGTLSALTITPPGTSTPQIQLDPNSSIAAINGTSIGGAIAAAGTFTRVTSTGNISGSATSTGSFGHILKGGVNWDTAVSSSAATAGFGTGGGGSSFAGAAGTETVFSGSSASTGSFGAGYIDNKLGIGTTSPTQKLEVDGVIESPYLEYKPVVFYDFNSNTTGDWTTYNTTLSTPNNSVTRYTTTGTDSNINRTFNFDGGQNQIIRIRYKVISGTAGGGQIFYTNSQHGFSGSYYKDLTLVYDGEWHTLVLDMSNLTAGGTDWLDYNVTSIRFDLTDITPVVIDIDWISVGGNGYAGVTVSNNSNDRILTGDGTNANAETNLTFDGSKLHVSGADGNIRLGDITAGSSNTDSGVMLNGAGSYESALFTEVNGEILSYGINVPQITTRNTTRSGGMFRFDIRNSGGFADAHSFVIKGYNDNSSTERNLFVIDLNDGNTVLVPNQGKVGIGTTSPGVALEVIGSISGSATSTGSFGHLMVGGGNFTSASLASSGGGSGGTTVTANPGSSGGGALSTITIGSTSYSVGGGSGGSSIWTTAGNVKRANVSLQLTGSSPANPAFYVSSSGVVISGSIPTVMIAATGSALEIAGVRSQLFEVTEKHAHDAYGRTVGGPNPSNSFHFTSSAALTISDEIGIPFFRIWEDHTIEFTQQMGSTLATSGSNYKHNSLPMQFMSRNGTISISGSSHPESAYTGSQIGNVALNVRGLGRILDVISEEPRERNELSVGSFGDESLKASGRGIFSVVDEASVSRFSVYDDGTFAFGIDQDYGKVFLTRGHQLIISQSGYGTDESTQLMKEIKGPQNYAVDIQSTGSLLNVQLFHGSPLLSVEEGEGTGALLGPQASRQVTSSFFSVSTLDGVPTFQTYQDGTYQLGQDAAKTHINRNGSVFISQSLSNVFNDFTHSLDDMGVDEYPLIVESSGSIARFQSVGASVVEIKEFQRTPVSASGIYDQDEDRRNRIFSATDYTGIGGIQLTQRGTVLLGDGDPLRIIGSSAPASEEKFAVTQSGYPALSPFSTVYALGSFDNSGWETTTSSSFGTSSYSPESHAFTGKILKVGTSDVERGKLYVLRQDATTAEEGHWYKAIASTAGSGSTNLLAVACGTGKSYEVGMLIEGVIRLEDKMMEDAPILGAEVYVSGTKLGGYDITATSTSAHFVRIIGNIIQKNAQNNTGGHAPYNDCLIYFNPDRTSLTLV